MVLLSHHLSSPTSPRCTSLNMYPHVPHFYPEYPQSNGKAENCVKTSKNLMKKAVQSNSDFHLTLLDWRNTPTEGMNSSRTQRMFGRHTRTLLPTSRELLKPQEVKDVRENKLQRKEVQARYYNSNAKELPGLAEGDIVCMKPQAADGKHHWIKAQVEGQVDVRFYAVRTEDGRLFRRNHKHLWTSKELFRPKDVEVDQTNAQPEFNQKAAMQALQ